MQRLIDANKFAEALKSVALRQKYDKLFSDNLLSVADIFDAIIADLKGTALNGYEYCPTVLEIPNNPTNGDMIKAIFPGELLTSITSTLWWGDNMSFNRDWWNAPYKSQESEDK